MSAELGASYAVNGSATGRRGSVAALRSSGFLKARASSVMRHGELLLNF